MCKTICGIDCIDCGFKEECGGCMATNGQPFGKECMVAECCKNKGHEHCDKCAIKPCELKKQLIDEFNALGIPDMATVTELYSLKGAYVNLEYTLASGQTIKFWEDNKLYLGNQICKKNSNRCYGLTADENYLLVCEYGDNGTDPEIIVFKKRNN